MNPSIETTSSSPSSTSPEKQAKAREAYKSRFNSLVTSTQTSLDDYNKKLEDGTLEDQANEPENSGEQRKTIMQSAISRNLDRLEQMKAILEGNEPIPSVSPQIEAKYTYTNPDTNKAELNETITLDLGQKLEEFKNFYTTHAMNDYLIFQKKYNTETSRYLDEKDWTWLLKAKSGARFVYSYWLPSNRKLYVNTLGAGNSYPSLGCHPSRYFV